LSNKKKKRRGVSAEIKEMLDKSIRVDITLHRRMIDMLAAQTLTIVKKRIEKLSNAGKSVSRYYQTFVKQMEAGNTSSALVICMIMHVLPEKETFAKFLLKRIICDEMMLDKIVKVTKTKLVLDRDQMNDRMWQIYEAWKFAKTPEQWKEQKKTLRDTYKGKSNNDFYNDLRELEKLTEVSLDVPYIFWLQTVALDGIYGLSTSDLEVIAEFQERGKSNDVEDEVQSALAVAKLLRKGRNKMRKRRTHVINTFLAPIGLAA
jgi:hypothetical protein